MASSLQVHDRSISCIRKNALAKHTFHVVDARTDKDCVLKMCCKQAYPVAIHRLMADAGFAPQILGDEMREDGCHIVLFELLDGYRQARPAGLPDATYVQLQRAMAFMHAKNIVHGDLRGPNVLHNREGRVMLIDFEFSGAVVIDRKSGKQTGPKYPPDLNTAIEWPAGASSGKVITAQHDLFWVQSLRQPPKQRCVHMPVLGIFHPITHFDPLCDASSIGQVSGCVTMTKRGAYCNCNTLL